MLSLGLLILRVVLGLLLMIHGSQKLFGWFGGKGLPGTMGMVTAMRMRPVQFWGMMAALSEFGGGLLAFLGFLSPVGPLGVIAAMSVAIVQSQGAKGFWAAKGGSEYPLMLLAGGLTLAFTGPGAYSLDGALGTALPEPAAVIIGLALVVLGVAVALGTRRPIRA